MNIGLTRTDLIAFQDDIQERFLAAEIRHPIHLCDPNQIDHLLPIFEKIQEQDWLFTSYRGIFHWLLKGVPPDELRDAIIRQGTMGFCDKDRRIVSSAIVGGCLPIAVGVAMGMKILGSNQKVWCFVGDMGSRGGAYHEAEQYARWHDLPISFVVEDNALSTNTPTQAVWGASPKWQNGAVLWYDYLRTVPHVGAGQWVTFS